MDAEPITFTIKPDPGLFLQRPPRAQGLVRLFQWCAVAAIAGVLLMIDVREPDEVLSGWTAYRVRAGQMLAMLFGIPALAWGSILLWSRLATRRELRRNHAAITAPFTVRVTDEAWEESGRFGSVSVKWEVFTGCTIKDKVLWLEMFRNSYRLLPLSQVPAPALDFILAQLRVRGLRIEDLRRLHADA